MQIDLSHPEFQAAIPIMKEIEAAGFEAYFVGGAVRDALLGLPPHDVDIASSAYPAEIKQIFNKTVDTGIQHGTVMVLKHGVGYEVTTFRTESGYQDFRRPDHVTFVRSLKEDLKRRDFTVNALAVRHDGTVIDLFDGLKDLADKRLRAVGEPGERFHEDALRMMRAVRFESQLSFGIETRTQEAIQENAPLLAKISVERIAAEFTRLMLGQNRRAGLTSFIATGLSEHAPMMAGHRDGLNALAALPATTIADPAVAWVLVCACLKLAPQPLLTAWKQANHLIDTVKSAVAVLPRLDDDWALYQAGENGVQVALAAAAYLAPRVDTKAVAARYERLAIHAKKELVVTGGDLIKHGMTPGPKLGQTLAKLERAVVAGKLPNDRAALLAASEAD